MLIKKQISYWQQEGIEPSVAYEAVTGAPPRDGFEPQWHNVEAELRGQYAAIKSPDERRAEDVAREGIKE